MNTKEFKLNDFYQAVILKTYGLHLLRLERAFGHTCTFVFADPEYKAEVVIERYWNKDLSLNARVLIENINELKSRIYAKS